jgi:transposase InsO family protein
MLAEIGHRLGRKNAFAHRYNHYRPHNALGGRTPNEYLTVMSQETQSSQMC